MIIIIIIIHIKDFLYYLKMRDWYSVSDFNGDLKASVGGEILPVVDKKTRLAEFVSLASNPSFSILAAKRRLIWRILISLIR